MPTIEDYHVSVDAFHGPLDLLLFLIRRAEVDIHDIPIATITDQYLAMLRQMQRIDIDAAGEFLVMAATLIEVKSRMLSPGTGGEGDGDDSAAAGDGCDAGDPRFELVQQLLAYQRFRSASEQLDARRHEFARRFPLRPGRRPRARTDPEDDGAAPALELDDIHVGDLAEAYERIASAIDFARLGEHNVALDETPIELYEADLVDRLKRTDGHTITLQEAFEGQAAPQRVGMFLATLELVRSQCVTVTQPEIESPIEIVLCETREEE